MDILILTSNRLQQAGYWKKQIEDHAEALNIPPNVLILDVCEDWSKGAGNCLGTLYAFQEAIKSAKNDHGRNIVEEIEKGASAAIYHMAGSGKRLEPLTAVERNNKPGVKIPSIRAPGQEAYPLTIIEAVIKQSMQMSLARRGRLSVFWPDQLFFFEQLPKEIPNTDISVVCQQHVLPSEHSWCQESLSRYGIIAKRDDNSYMHLDKVDCPTAIKYAQKSLSVSLGSFSWSLEFTRKLLAFFAAELAAREAKMDVEPHLFMPLTLPKDLFVRLMVNRDWNRHEAEFHYQRIQDFVHSEGPVTYSVEDIGFGGHWWDLGCLESYYHTLLSLPQMPQLKEFLLPAWTQPTTSCDIDQESILINCQIKRGVIRNSVLCGVVAEEFNAENTVALMVHAPKVDSKDALIYNARSGEPIQMQSGSVRADLDIMQPSESEHIVELTRWERDGKLDWNKRLFNNKYTYAELEQMSSMIID